MEITRDVRNSIFLVLECGIRQLKSGWDIHTCNIPSYIAHVVGCAFKNIVNLTVTVPPKTLQ